MTPQEFYEYRKVDETSGFGVGSVSSWVFVYQEVVGRPETGVWSEADEKAWNEYRDTKNWNLVMEIMDFPSTWDTGVRPDDILLNLEF